jgi:hypothetical protein
MKAFWPLAMGCARSAQRTGSTVMVVVRFVPVISTRIRQKVNREN